VNGRVRVWDPAVRVLHWTLVAAFVLAWATTVGFAGWHEPIGYAGLAIVAVRIAWGFAGPRTARFASFVRGPRATTAYLRLFLRGAAPRHLGHNPLGAWMILTLIACMVALGVTGWLYRTDRFWGDETLERVHTVLAWAMLALVVVHVAGVAISSFRHRENLVAAMFNGTKRRPEQGDIE